MFQTKRQTQTTVDTSKSLPLLKEVEVIYSSPKIAEPVQIGSSMDSYKVLEEIYDVRKIDYKEMFYVLLLNYSNYCIGASQIGTGSTAGVAVNIKEIFQLALKTNASKIIVSHNHPSGSLIASNADISITKKIKSGCETLDIELVDHIIITSTRYLSFADEGLL